MTPPQDIQIARRLDLNIFQPRRKRGEFSFQLRVEPAISKPRAETLGFGGVAREAKCCDQRRGRLAVRRVRDQPFNPVRMKVEAAGQ
jgi:hypothetical protein